MSWVTFHTIVNLMRYGMLFLLSRSQTTSLRSAVIGRAENRPHLHGCVMVMKGVMCFWHVSCLLISLIQDASNVVWELDTEFIIFWKGTDANSSGTLGSPTPIKSSCKVWRQTNEVCVCVCVCAEWTNDVIRRREIRGFGKRGTCRKHFSTCECVYIRPVIRIWANFKCPKTKRKYYK